LIGGTGGAVGGGGRAFFSAFIGGRGLNSGFSSSGGGEGSGLGFGF
jgi:hypothetical protein